MIQYPSHIVEEAGQRTDRALREIIDKLNENDPQIEGLDKRLGALKIPTVAEIQKDLQLGGTNTINITGVLGVAGQPQIAATAGTHAQRLTTPAQVGSLWFETDRNYLYVGKTSGSTAVWVFVAGMMESGVASIPADLGASDVGALFYGTDTFTQYSWDGTNWKTTGGAIERPLTNSVTAFQVQNAAATSTVLDVDTTNKRVGIGDNNTAPATTLDVLGTLKIKASADGVTVFQFQAAGGGVVLNIDTTNARVGINDASPSVDFDVNGIIAAVTGYRQNGSEATATFVLASNGTNFVGRALASADLPTTVAAHTITLAALTGGGTTGSITWNAAGQVTAFVDPT